MPHYDEARGLLSGELNNPATVLASTIRAATSKATPVDADELPITDSATGFSLKKLTWANLKATLATWLAGNTVAASLTSVSASAGLWASGPAVLGVTGAAGTISYEYPTTRIYMGDGTGYSFAISLRTGSVTTDIFKVNEFGNAVLARNLTVLGGSTLLQTSSALTNGAAAAAGTLLNAPVAGNPTKWIPINDNGTTRYIPTW